MKRLFLSLAGVLVAHAAPADLLISEYVEGSSNNKALELHNIGETILNLADYKLELYSNGNSSPNASMTLNGSLEPGAVWVIANSGADHDVLALADETSNSVVNHNGDDAFVLRRDGVVVDSFGRVGEDPGEAWTSGDITTKDRTLRRRETVTTGDTVIDDAFNPADQWAVFSQNDFSGLGLPGQEGTEEEEPPMVELGSCGDPATLISQIQGQGEASPLDGEAHVVEAVVTGIFPDLSGFFVIEEDSDRDGNDLTSEGLFVYTGNNEVSVQAGNQVRVSGAISEYYGQTQIAWNEGAVCADQLAVAPVTLTLPLTAPDQLEALESMWVVSDQTLTVSEVYDLARYGSVMLSHGRRMIPTHAAEPGEAADAVAEINALNRILLDDGSNDENPATVIYPDGGLSATNTLRVGDTITGLEGIVSYGFNDWRIQPILVQIEASNPRPQPPARTAGSNLRVAAFNVLNFFNGDGNGGGFDDPDYRGANNPAEFERQKAKILTALSQLDADVIGLMEIENDGYGTDAAIAELTEALGTSWAFVDPGLERLGTDVIAVGLLYRTDVVEPVGQPATLEGGPFTDKSRQPLAMSFRHLNSGEVVTVSVNHLKSKGSCPDDSSDNAEHGQGCWNPLRTESARMLSDWLANNPTGLQEAAAGTLIIGDLNAYAKEDPIRALEQAGYQNLLARFNDDDAYSYIYKGETGYLDHALADAGLESAILGAGEWHINADEPRALDYNTEYKSDDQIGSFYAADAYRASDHDPVWVDLALDGDEDDSGSSGGGALGGVITLALLVGLRRRVRR
ncbi:extracellular nuclease [Alcanivorax xiamenensis]|uniref:Extracellular nuclease n=1 Tax=Alcanivorax xiamenensis TaxID=1177156 RepID=A0ABQ6YDM6_9GAMM|nr:ExeM/NucH family extracellular endonuclease [Alcanivorax xiamenensis]KAF0808456.1 extracellular nuclease [Alcanivorax xiamenensis]